MKTFIVIISILSLFIVYDNLITQDVNMKHNKLTSEEKRVIIDKGTEMPFTGKYYDHKESGTYICKRCDAPLYKSEDKFDSQCGWPSFDDEIIGAVRHQPDADGQREEILCGNCDAHLGHIFLGEGFTDKNVRHCVNSISLNFIPDDKNIDKSIEKAIFAGGCFWGVEYYFQQVDGVISTNVGYTGGNIKNPTYEQVCYGNTGHIEAIEVIFNPHDVSFEKLAKLFFEIHDPTQVNRQGPDIGEQYRSAIFYFDEKQKKTAEKLVNILESKGFGISTTLEHASEFWNAEEYHQDYYKNNGKEPYCHFYQKRF